MTDLLTPKIDRDKDSPYSGIEDIKADFLTAVKVFYGAQAPTTTYPAMCWADADNHLLKQRNEQNTAWKIIATLDDTLVVEKESDYTAILRDAYKVIEGNAAQGEITLTLPPLAAVSSGMPYTFKKMESSSHAVIVKAHGNELIDNDNEYRLVAFKQAITVRASLTPGKQKWVVVYDAEDTSAKGTVSITPSDKDANFAADKIVGSDNVKVNIVGENHASQKLQLDLANTGVMGGVYPKANVTVNKKGLITAISNGATHEVVMRQLKFAVKKNDQDIPNSEWRDISEILITIMPKVKSNILTIEGFVNFSVRSIQTWTYVNNFLRLLINGSPKHSIVENSFKMASSGFWFVTSVPFFWIMTADSTSALEFKLQCRIDPAFSKATKITAGGIMKITEYEVPA